MAANPRTLEAEQAYRQRVRGVQRQAVLGVADQFRGIDPDNISATLPAAIEGMANVVGLSQAAAQQAASEYFGEASALETGRFRVGPNAANIAGQSNTGGTLVDAMGSIAPAIFQGLKGGMPAGQAMQFGLHRASMIAATATLEAAHRELEHQVRQGSVHGYIIVGGGAKSCPLCRRVQNGEVRPASQSFRPVHPGCSCVTAPAFRRDDRREPAPEQVVDELTDDELRVVAGEIAGPPSVSLEAGVRARFPGLEGWALEREILRVRVAAERLLGQYAPLESRITSDISDVARIANGRAAGLQYRLKEAPSLSRKVAEDMVEKNYLAQEAVDNINDAVRYTIVRADDAYTQGAIDTIRELRERGYTFLKRPKNFWGQDGYQGLHTLLRSPTGVRLELQFHTARSIEVKEISHRIIDLMRATSDPAVRRRLRLATNRLWADNLRRHPARAAELQALIEEAGGWVG